MDDQPGNDDAAIAQCVADVHGERPLRLERQAFAHSGNAVYRAHMPGGRSLAVRVSPKAQTFLHTGANLATLHGLGLPVQTVLSQGTTPAGGDFVVLDWLPGRDLFYVFDSLDARQTERIAEAVIEIQCRVAQQLPATAQGSFGWTAIGARAPRARWTEIFDEPTPIASHVATLARADATPLDRFRARLGLVRASLEDYFDTLRPVCFLHDLTIKNVLVDDNELSGLIDFDSVCYGDPLLVLGTTLAHIDTLVGERGRRYAEALLRCWAPQGERRRATGFYASLWVIGFLAAAIEQGNAASVHFLTPVVDQLLRVAERA
ncbi:phosphotransferase family protein [Paraburkholderia bryophila]|uniref:Aminoglycoside phosphotransferase (APT) family kinase protein n=1 Tax=Paraburkholderia bryophila TaxID=420952 RepID=A0A7Y9WU83_9BURK|nr:aminoglycoside phosphotransferase family protein [Paraburkholderia bryophila]NYH26882.1 aminoglycoside phosphotransferase (APT) family kinase protein [Paraburkholderia bryophila]